MKVTFILRNNGEIPEDADVYIIGNNKPFDWNLWNSIKMIKTSKKNYEIEINYNNVKILLYKYIFINQNKDKEEGFFNGQYGAREIELKDNLVITDIWNQQTLHSKKKPCAFLWNSPIIAWDGKVTVCCADDDFLLSVGNLNKESLKDIWDGNKITQFRLNHIKGEFNKMPSDKNKEMPFCLACHDLGNITLSDEEVIQYLKSIKKEELIDEYKKRIQNSTE